MKYLDINREYIDLILEDPEIHLGNYKAAQEKAANLGALSVATYNRKPVPFLYQPMFFTEEDINNFKKIGNIMMSISNKVTDRYIEDEDFRKKFGFSDLLEELILADNGYDINVPIGRFDIFYRNYDDFKFCELNTDGSSGMNEDNIIGKVLLETKGLKEFSERYSLNIFELFYSWVKESIKIYEKFNPDGPKPNVAIVDFNESGSSSEFERFKEVYIESGYNCIIADPKDLSYRDGKLYYEDYRIDLVYRRIVTFELIERADEIPDFIEAYKNKAMCTIGSVKSQVVHNKVIFKILHDEDTLEFLSQEERQFVKNHIPITGLFSDDGKVFNEVLNNKDKYIMKPLDLNAARGVFAGRDFKFEEWKLKLKEAWNKDYIYQEFVQSPTREFLVFDNDKMSVEEFGSVIGLFMYNKKFAGLYTRIGQKSIISGLSQYYTAPNILVKEKDN